MMHVAFYFAVQAHFEMVKIFLYLQQREQTVSSDVVLPLIVQCDCKF